MAPNIRDIARMAGVSVATVSKVINNYPHISPKTKEKVMTVIKDAQFMPNSVARGLVKGRSMTLGMFLTTGLVHPFFVHILAGMEDSLKESGFDLLYLSQVNWNPDYSFVRHCMSRNVEGVVVFGFQRFDLNLDELVQSEIPAIFIDLDMLGKKAGYVTSDNVDGIRKSVRYLKEIGHTRIAFLTGGLESYVGKLRFEGYKQGLADLGLPYLSEYVYIGDFSRESGIEATQKFLSLEHRPTAIVCSSDMGAVGVIEAMKEAGLSVPGDMSVIGFDDIDIATHTMPSLTTIRQDTFGIGQNSIRLLLEIINNANCPPPTMIVPTELVVRDSCAPLA